MKNIKYGILIILSSLFIYSGIQSSARSSTGETAGVAGGGTKRSRRARGSISGPVGVSGVAPEGETVDKKVKTGAEALAPTETKSAPVSAAIEPAVYSSVAVAAAEEKKEEASEMREFNSEATKLLWDVLPTTPLRDVTPSTPLNNHKQVEAALKSGANPNARNPQGYSPLGYVLWEGDYPGEKNTDNALAELLIKYGADTFAPIKANNLTLPIHKASKNLNIRLIKALLSKSPASQVNARDEAGRTPLEMTLDEIVHGFGGPVGTAIDLLLSKGADLFAKNLEGNDMLTQAIKDKAVIDKKIAKAGTSNKKRESLSGSQLHDLNLRGSLEQIIKLLQSKFITR